MAAEVLDQNAQINDVLVVIRAQLREVWQADQYGVWDGTLTFQPRKFSELESGSRYKKRLASNPQKN